MSLYVKGLKRLMLWFRQREAGSLRERFAVSAVEQFERNVQIVRNSLSLLTFLVLKQRQIIDGLCGNPMRTAEASTKAIRFCGDRCRIEAAAQKDDVRPARQPVFDRPMQSLAIVFYVFLILLIEEQVFYWE